MYFQGEQLKKIGLIFIATNYEHCKVSNHFMFNNPTSWDHSNMHSYMFKKKKSILFVFWK